MFQLSKLQRLVSCILSCSTTFFLWLAYTSAHAGNPGLPFVETFTDTDLQNLTVTTADWNIENGTVTLNQALPFTSPFPDDIATPRYGVNSIPESNWRIISDDINGDGQSDLAVAVGLNPEDPNAVSSPSIRLYFNRGPAALTNPYATSAARAIVGLPDTNDDTRAVAAGDVDNDGDIDLVAGNLGVNRLYLHDDPNFRFGNFTSQNLTSGETHGLKLHDINNDQLLDLIIANNGSNQILLNDGDDQPFNDNPPITLPGGASDSSQITIIDFNADNQPDLLFANRNQANQLFLHTGSAPFFGNPINIGSANDSRDITACDLDGDGDIDIAVANYAQKNVWYRNLGDGSSFSSAINITDATDNTTGIMAIEADNDGDIDLGFANDNSDNLVITNNGSNDPFLAAETIVLGDPDKRTTGIVALDNNLDGLQDLWVSNLKIAGESGSNRGRGYMNKVADQNFSSFSEIKLNSPINRNLVAQRDIAIGDINNDGLLDIAVGAHTDFNDQPEQNFINLNNGTDDPFSNPPIYVPNNPNDADTTEILELADINNDGYLDLLTGNLIEKNRIYLNNQTNNPYSATPIEFGSDIINQSFGIADVNRDGYLDIVVTYSLTDTPTQLFLNSGIPPFFETPIDLTKDGTDPVSQGWAAILSDLNTDGFVDLIIADAEFRPSLIFIHSGQNNPFPNNPIEMAQDRTSISAAILDANRDGDTDILLGNVLDDFNDELYLNDGSLGIVNNNSPVPITSNTENTRFLLIEDFNRNGKNEIAEFKPEEDFLIEIDIQTDGQLKFRENRLLDSTPDIPLLFGLEADKGDVDNDGDIDIVVVEQGNDNQNYIIINNLQPQPFIDVIDNPFVNDSSNTTDILLVDINQDGEVDTITTTLSGANTFYANNESSSPFADVAATDLRGGINDAYGLVSADFDMDGDPDLAIAIDGANQLLFNNDSISPFNNVTPLTFGNTGLTRALAVGDVDLDGDVDIVTAEFGMPNQLILNSRSANPLDTAIDIGTAAHDSTDVALRDINIDGLLDAVVSNAGQPDLVYLNTGSAPYFETAITLPNSTGQSIAIATADLDTDGDNDIAIADKGGVNRVYYFDRSSDTFSNSTVGNDAENSTDIQAVDIDYDGDIDLIVSNSNGMDKIYNHSGDDSPFANATGISIFDTPLSSQALAIDDVDYDGLLDIVVGISGQNVWYERGQDEAIEAVRFNVNANLAGSIEVDNSTDPITEIVLSAKADLPPNTSIDYFLSNDDGVTFFPVQPGVPLTFLTTGNQLRWKAKLNSCSPSVTPTLSSLTLRLPSADEPPSTNGIADVTVNEDADDTVIDLTTAFDDTETAPENLIYSIINTPDNTLVIANINDNNELILDYVENAFGMDSLTIQAQDEAQQTISTMFWLEVLAVNDTPVSNGIDNITVQEDADNTSTALPPVFHDVETPDSDLMFAIEANNNSALFNSVTVDNAGNLIIDYAPDAFGEAQLTVSAEDADNATITATFTITITPVNDAPTTTGLAAVTVDEDAPTSTINLLTAFDDIETADADLAFVVDNNTNASLFNGINISDNGVLQIAYASNASGQATLTLSATDEGSLSIDTSFTVTVNPVNDTPTSNPIDDLDVQEDAANSSISLYPAFDDPETPDNLLIFSITDNSNTALFDSTSIDQNGNLILDYAPNAFGQANLTLAAEDPEGATAHNTVLINVAPVNDIPTANPIASIAVDEDADNTNIDLYPAFDDIETTDTELTFVISNLGDATLFESVSITDNGQLVIDYAANTNGQASITLTATDAGSATVQNQVIVTINPVNDMPSSSTIEDIETDFNSPNRIIDLFEIFNDIETADADLFLSIENNSNPALFDSVSIQPNGQLVIDYSPNASGEAEITLSATDGGNASITTRFTIRVSESDRFESNGGGTSGWLTLLALFALLLLNINRSQRNRTHEKSS